jgi:prolipoprotein diacylglyceryltransferase
VGVTISSGQVLSIPMIAVGAGVMIWAYKFQKNSPVETYNVEPKPASKKAAAKNARKK